jgi:N-acylneuraminate cytidylyltransferase
MNYGTVAFIPVRGGSKSIPLKNIKQIAGKPLVKWVIEAANNSNLIDHIFVSTDSIDIKNVVESFKITKLTVIARSQESATDTAPSELALIEFAQEIEFDNVVFIQATSPLLTKEQLDEAIHNFNESSYDSMLSVVREKRFIWKEENGIAVPLNYDPKERPRRQDFKGHFVENGAFYITKRRALLESKCRISGNIGLYEMPSNTYFEIDEPEDWIIIEEFLKRQNKKEFKKRLKNIKMLVTDCDGVLTDGGMYYSENGDELKKFNTKDGYGISLLKEKGIITVLITGEDRELVKRRAEKLNFDEIHLGIKNKLSSMEDILKRHNLTFEEVAYIGDDLNDLEVMKKVGFPFTVNDSMDKVKEISKYIASKNGGEGAVREIIEFILN